MGTYSSISEIRQCLRRGKIPVGRIEFHGRRTGHDGRKYAAITLVFYRLSTMDTQHFLGKRSGPDVGNFTDKIAGCFAGDIEVAAWHINGAADTLYVELEQTPVQDGVA